MGNYESIVCLCCQACHTLKGEVIQVICMACACATIHLSGTGCAGFNEVATFALNMLTPIGDN